MYPSGFRVVLDANVLFPFTLRDTLLRAAELGLFQAYWSEAILDEVSRNLVSTMTVTPHQARSLVTTMSEAFPEAKVTGYERLIASMRNDEKDRHVAAAAVQVGAQVIVTNNLRDFTDLPPGIEAQSPDDFLCHVFHLDPAAVTELLHRQAQDHRRPPRTFEQLLDGLAKTAPRFVSSVRASLSPKE